VPEVRGSTRATALGTRTLGTGTLGTRTLVRGGGVACISGVDRCSGVGHPETAAGTRAGTAARRAALARGAATTGEAPTAAARATEAPARTGSASHAAVAEIEHDVLSAREHARPGERAPQQPAHRSGRH